MLLIRSLGAIFKTIGIFLVIFIYNSNANERFPNRVTDETLQVYRPTKYRPIQSGESYNIYTTRIFNQDQEPSSKFSTLKNTLPKEPHQLGLFSVAAKRDSLMSGPILGSSMRLHSLLRIRNPCAGSWVHTPSSEPPSLAAGVTPAQQILTVTAQLNRARFLMRTLLGKFEEAGMDLVVNVGSFNFATLTFINANQVEQSLILIYNEISKAALVLEEIVPGLSRPAFLQPTMNLKEEAYHILCGLRVYMDSRGIQIPPRQRELLLGSRLPAVRSNAARVARNYTVLQKIDSFLLSAQLFISQLAHVQ